MFFSVCDYQASSGRGGGVVPRILFLIVCLGRRRSGLLSPFDLL
jgi:hypothetical protein